ncbi:MAG: TolC family protein [Deltaproteobacteria bacterium]|nr:TolC family protein [Deltaproteobacteria bacterium]
MTIEQAIAAAMRRNPELAATRVDVGVRAARAVQAGLRPNPTLGFEAEDVAGSDRRAGWEAGQTTLSVSQALELGGKRQKRRRTANLERDVASWDIVVRLRALVSEVRKAFAATLIAQDRLTLSEKLIRIAEDSVRSVGVTVDAGAVSPVERLRAEVNLSRARASRLAARRELENARSILAATWGEPSPLFERAAGALSPAVRPAPLETLLPNIGKIPDLARADAEIEQRRAALSLEQSRRIPDLSLVAGGRHYAEDGGGALVFGFSLPLPLFDRNQGNILAAAREVAQARLAHDAVAVTVEARARQAYVAVEAAAEQASIFRDETIPRAERAYAGAKDGYARGLFRYLEVLDAQRTLFELRAEYLTALATYYDASAELSRWVEHSDTSPERAHGDRHD